MRRSVPPLFTGSRQSHRRLLLVGLGTNLWSHSPALGIGASRWVSAVPLGEVDCLWHRCFVHLGEPFRPQTGHTTCCNHCVGFGAARLPVCRCACISGSVDWQQALSFHLKVPFDGTFGNFTSAMAGLYLIGFAARAFEAAACHVGETINPEKNVPRAMFVSAWMATLYFFVLPIVWLGVLGPDSLTGELAQVFGADVRPVTGGIGESSGRVVHDPEHVPWDPDASDGSCENPVTTCRRRTASHQSLRSDRGQTFPWIASAFTAFMAIVFLLMGDPFWLIASANFTYLIGIALPSVAVWLLRRNQPQMHRPPTGHLGPHTSCSA